MAGLPKNMAALIRAESAASHTQHMFDVKSNIASSGNIVRHSAARMLDEGSPANARAVDKILRLPK